VSFFLSLSLSCFLASFGGWWVVRVVDAEGMMDGRKKERGR